jgi:hypothetical protein
LEERIRLLEASNKDLKQGLGYTLEALDYQRKKLYECERSSFDLNGMSAWGARYKIRKYEGDRDSMASKILGNNRELESCRARLKEIGGQ